MAIAPVLKTGVRKGMGVRIPRSPPLTKASLSFYFNHLNIFLTTPLSGVATILQRFPKFSTAERLP